MSLDRERGDLERRFRTTGALEDELRWLRALARAGCGNETEHGLYEIARLRRINEDHHRCLFCGNHIILRNPEWADKPEYQHRPDCSLLARLRAHEAQCRLCQVEGNHEGLSETFR